jgi:DNA polymerase I-like protein with 3'-5' exonuclease and polymerase domains
MGIDVLFHHTFEDDPYLAYLKEVFRKFGSSVGSVHLTNLVPEVSVLEVALKAKEKNCKYVITTSEKLLGMLVGDIGRKKPSIDNYAGSLFKKYDLEWLIVHPVKQLVTVAYGGFLYERYFSKIFSSSKWLSVPNFLWNLYSREAVFQRSVYDLFKVSQFISIDIETIEDDPDRSISCIGFTGVRFDLFRKSYSAFTVVVPLTDSDAVSFARTICRLPVAKLFQNGKYDNAYLLRYSIEVINWSYDTAHLFHSWYSELPKDLGSITAFCVRDYVYHKDMARNATSLEEYYEYNARDCYYTAMSFIALINEMPQWAMENYYQEFPLVFPCLLAELTGIRQDEERRLQLENILDKKIDKEESAIRIMVNNPFYNSNSSQQTVRLLAVLGCGDITSSDVISMDKAKARHPLNKKILGRIQKFREDRKLNSTYIGKEASWCGRIFYQLNPHGTDTGRLASKQSNFWCGLQIHNIPVDEGGANSEDKLAISVKSTLVADEGFYIGECDYSQAETFDTAYLSGDIKLLEAINDRSKDFHGRNASEFFGIPYDRIVHTVADEKGLFIHKTLDKHIRNLSKRTNHGANYNMGPNVLLNTMGIENVMRAKVLLKLPKHYSLLQVCQYLLNQFDRTYPVVRGSYHEYIKTTVASVRRLVGPTGWTRYCFQNPQTNKHALNAYVAHPSQSLNAMCLNRAWRDIFNTIWRNNTITFKLCAQIHDSILFQYRRGQEDLAWQVAKIMERSANIDVTDSFNITRRMKIPTDLKGNAVRWSDIEELHEVAA